MIGDDTRRDALYLELYAITCFTQWACFVPDAIKGQQRSTNTSSLHKTEINNYFPAQSLSTNSNSEEDKY